MSGPKYVSLFSGAGGLDIGLERAGFTAVSQCEIDDVFCDTLRANQGAKRADGRSYFSEARIVARDVALLTGKELKCGQEIDLVVGGPPCQSFSSAGKQLSVLDPRGLLVHEFFRIVDEIQPKMFLFENVRGLVTARDSNGEPGGVIRDLLERFWGTGYSARATLLNSADFGSYQRRVRCFIVGSRYGRAPVFPSPTHQKTSDLVHKPWNCLRDFLAHHADGDEGNFTYPTAALAAQLEALPNGSGLKSAGKAETTRPGGHWGYRQGTFIADLDLPARTVTGSSSQDWIRWDGRLRRLTLPEIMQLQGFPIDWELCGTKAQKYKQVGNAVPTVFGRILGNMIGGHLKDFPSSRPERIEMPKSFKGYIDYTKKDQARNGEARSVHRKFGKA